MDPQTMVIGAAIFVVSAIVIYLISVCSMREKTFEEVLEEQRKLQAEELKKLKVEKKEKVRKRYPGRGKGKKDKGEDKVENVAAVTPLLDSESETDRIVEPEVIEPQVIEPVQQQKPEKKKKEKKKPREEVPAIHEEDLYEPLVKEQVEEVAIEAQHAPVTVEAPVREHSHKEKKSKRVHKEEQIEEQIIVQEEIRVQEVAPLKSEAPQVENKKSKKKSAESGAGEKHGLVQMVRTAALSESDKTDLIEILQNKQGAAPTEWTKKSKQTDAVTVLKKQLEDKERMFQDEHQLATNAAQKLRDLRAELSRERQRIESLEHQLNDKMKGQEQEKDALRARMQQTHEQHSAEVTALRRQVEVAKLSQDQAGLVQRLTEENQKLKEAAAQAQAAAQRQNNDKQALKMMQEELSKNVVKLNASTNQNKQLETQLARFKEQLQKMESTQHEVVARKMNDMSEELHRSEGRNAAIGKELEMARSGATRYEQELTNLHNRMKDLQAQEAHSRTLEQQLQESMHSKKSMESRLVEVERANKNTDSQLKQLREENNLLAAQLKESKERTSGEGQEAPAAEVNGEVSSQGKADTETAKLLGEKESEIGKLQAELKAKVQETSKLSDDLDAQKQKNNELLTKQEAIVVELKQQASSKEDGQVDLVKRLEDELNSKNVQLTELDTLRKQIAEFGEQQKTIESYKVELVQRDEQLKVLGELKTQVSAQTSELSAYAQLKKEVEIKDAEIKKFSELKEQSEGKEVQLRESLSLELKSRESEVVLLTEQLTKMKEEQNQDLQNSTESASQLSSQLERVTAELGSKTTQVSDLQQTVQGLEASQANLTKQATKSADDDRLVGELDATNQRLQKVSKELEDVRAANQALQQQQQQVQEEVVTKSQASVVTSAPAPTNKSTTLQDVTILTRVEEKSSFDVSRILADLDARDVELTILQNVLSQKEAENSKFKEQLAGTNSLHRELNDRTSEVSSLNQQLNLQKQKTHEMQQQLAQGRPAGQAMAANDDTAFLKEQVEVKTTEITNLRDIVKSYWTENNALKEKLEALEEEQEDTASAPPGGDPEKVARLEEEVTSVRRELEGRTAQFEKSNSDLLQQAKELQEQNKAISEKAAQQAQAISGQQELTKELQNTKKVLHSIFPDVAVSETTKYSEWLSTFEKQAKQYVISATQNGDYSKELEDSQQAQSKLQAQVQQYKDVLADTEGILNKLQSSVEEEEKKWRQKVATSDDRCNQLDQEVKTLTDKLSTIEDDRLALQSKISESTQSLNSLKSELMDITTDVSSKDEEVTKVKQELEQAYKEKKELNTAKVRLNGMLKTGQDALKHEQQEVNKLRAQLTEKSKGLANGSSRPQEIEQLKTNLTQTQKQLDREVQLNKQLTQRLGAGAESKEDGTSV